MSASLIGRLGQARFLSLVGITVAHPGHASLRSPIDALLGTAARMCRIGRGEPRLETRFSICAADTFGFIHEPRPVRTTPFRCVGVCL